MSGGLRYNQGKLPVNLVPASLTKSVAEVLKYGASKYEDRNWEKGMSWETVLGCLERHLLEVKDPTSNDLDEESGLPHIYHVACNAMMLIEYMITHPELDDRQKPDNLKSHKKNTHTKIEKEKPNKLEVVESEKLDKWIESKL